MRRCKRRREPDHAWPVVRSRRYDFLGEGFSPAGRGGAKAGAAAGVGKPSKKETIPDAPVSLSGPKSGPGPARAPFGRAGTIAARLLVQDGRPSRSRDETRLRRPSRRAPSPMEEAPGVRDPAAVFGQCGYRQRSGANHKGQPALSRRDGMVSAARDRLHRPGFLAQGVVTLLMIFEMLLRTSLASRPRCIDAKFAYAAISLSRGSSRRGGRKP